jgi:hypothetical protein
VAAVGHAQLNPRSPTPCSREEEELMWLGSGGSHKTEVGGATVPAKA